MSAISVADYRVLLDFERAATELHLHPRVKARFVREDFAVSLTRYHQILGAVIWTPEALRYAPQLVARLRRLREERRGIRTARRLGDPGPTPRAPWHPSLSFPEGRTA